MKNIKFNSTIAALFLSLLTLFSTLENRLEAATIAKTKLSYFNGAINLFISGQTTSSSGKFSVEVKDATGNPYPAITAQWINATLEMVDMDMGITTAIVTNDGPAKVKVQTPFSMQGQWKLNLRLTTAAGSETHSIKFNAP